MNRFVVVTTYEGADGNFHTMLEKPAAYPFGDVVPTTRAKARRLRDDLNRVFPDETHTVMKLVMAKA